MIMYKRFNLIAKILPTLTIFAFASFNSYVQADDTNKKPEAPTPKETKAIKKPPIKAKSTKKSEVKKGDEINKKSEKSPITFTRKIHWTPLQLSLLYPAQVFNKNFNVHGMRLGMIHARNRNVKGLDFNLGMAETNSVFGFQFANLGKTKEMTGIQILTVDLDLAEAKKVNGIQIVAIALPARAKTMNGLQVACFYGSTHYSNGAQVSTHFSETKILNGVQISGVFNRAKEVNGFQIGLVNWSDKLSGAQFGALNFATDNWLPFSIGLNFGF